MPGFGKNPSAVLWVELCVALWHMRHCAVPTGSDVRCSEGSSTVGLHSLKSQNRTHASPPGYCADWRLGRSLAMHTPETCTATPRPSLSHTLGQLTGESHSSQDGSPKDRCEQLPGAGWSWPCLYSQCTIAYV